MSEDAFRKTEKLQYSKVDRMSVTSRLTLQIKSKTESVVGEREDIQVKPVYSLVTIFILSPFHV
jgi:hypothetical protein